jgi:predicted phosphodiesterase
MKQTKLSSEVSAFLKKAKREYSFEELSSHFKTTVAKIKATIKALGKTELNLFIHDEKVAISRLIQPNPPTHFKEKHLQGEWIKFGFVTDNHLGSKYERLDVLNRAYEHFQEVGIKTVFNAGNIIDGEARFNKFDIHTHGMQGQVDYFIRKYPRVEGITTHYITGDDHEGWYTQREGVNIGKFMQMQANEAGRNDLIYLGHMEHDVIIKKPHGNCVIRVQHPGGGSSYAISYTSQKIVESFSSGEKPHVLLIGHYHKSAYNYIRGIHVVQGGCTMEQSPFMRKKRLDAHIGYWIIEMKISDGGTVTNFRSEYVSFYDSGFYKKGWDYQW